MKFTDKELKRPKEFWFQSEFQCNGQKPEPHFSGYIFMKQVFFCGILNRITIEIIVILYNIYALPVVSDEVQITFIKPQNVMRS